jgi:hypothetical protein
MPLHWTTPQSLESAQGLPRGLCVHVLRFPRSHCSYWLLTGEHQRQTPSLLRCCTAAKLVYFAAVRFNGSPSAYFGFWSRPGCVLFSEIFLRSGEETWLASLNPNTIFLPVLRVVGTATSGAQLRRSTQIVIWLRYALRSYSSQKLKNLQRSARMCLWFSKRSWILVVISNLAPM